MVQGITELVIESTKDFRNINLKVKVVLIRDQNLTLRKVFRDFIGANVMAEVVFVSDVV